ncbi:hypothetical protein D3C81_813860 [compost metagenome]
MVPAQALGGGDEHFQRRVAGAGAHAGQRGVDAVAALFHRGDRVGHAEAEVVVGVHAGLGRRIEHRLEGAHAVTDVLHVHRATGVGHVDALRTVALHQLALRGQLLGGDHVAHHQEADGVHAERTGVLDVLLRHVRFGAVGGDAHRTGAGVVGGLQIVHRADAGQQQHGDLRLLDHVGGGLDPLQVGVGAEAVVEAGALQAVAVGDFDGVDLGLVQRAGDVLHVLDRVLVAHGVAAVAQGDVGDVQLLAGIEGHGGAPYAFCSCGWDSIDCAMRSAVASAAEVMMSRLPA